MTIEALKKSIEKWKGVVDGTYTDIGNKDCPLCSLYIDNECLKCPIREKTKSSYCERTPYVRWALLTSSERGLGRNVRNFPRAKIHAEAELKFLKDLLAELETKEK